MAATAAMSSFFPSLKLENAQIEATKRKIGLQSIAAFCVDERRAFARLPYFFYLIYILSCSMCGSQAGGL